MAKRGRVAVEVCSSAFVALGRAQASALGYSALPIAIVPHPFGTVSREEVRVMAQDCVAQIAEQACATASAVPAVGAAEQEARAAPCAQFEIADAPDAFTAFNKLAREKRWSDGLPVVLPTRERVDAMLAYTKRKRNEVIARLAPAFGAATVESIAINAVLAGCDSEYLSVLIAAVEAVAGAPFNLQSIQSTTNPAAVWIIVNGPIAAKLGINCGPNCLGEGAHANVSIGRALRLLLRNVGGALPGEMDRATQGQPGKLSFCCAENEAESPWEPLHVERGHDGRDSAVTVVGAEGTMNMCTLGKNADDLIRVMADTMRHAPSNEYVHGSEPWLLLCPEHARIIHEAGIRKAELKRRLWEESKMRAGVMAAEDFERAQASRTAELGRITPDTMLTIAKKPEDIGIVVAGGTGAHSVYIPCFGNTRSVTRRVTEFSM